MPYLFKIGSLLAVLGGSDIRKLLSAGSDDVVQATFVAIDKITLLA